MGRPQRPIAVHVVTRLVLGGPTRPVLAGLERLARRGFRTVLVTGVASSHEIEAREILEDYPDLPVLRLRCLVRNPAPHRDARALGTLAAAVRRLQPAVVHTHTAKAGCLGRLAAATGRRRPRVVHTYHGHSMTRAAAGALGPCWRILERLLAARTDLILALSQGQRAELARLLGPRAAARMAVLPLGCELDGGGAGSVPRVSELRPPGGRLLAFLGRGVPVKGLDRLARAHARAAARWPRLLDALRILVAGPVEPGVEREVRRVLAAGGIGERWRFVGPVVRPVPFLEQVDGLVLPSRSEGTPVAVIEALGCGLPVLAAAVGGVPDLLARDWIRDGPGRWRAVRREPRGRLLPPEDTEAWAAALAGFAREPGAVPGDPLERRAFARTVFDPDRRAEDLARLYGAIEAGMPRPAAAPRRTRPLAASPGVPPVPDQPRPAV
ncbi:MAG: glycosyltransferase [Acidobacteria bacterium]|nr:MAG: glycosyltransferase [Acidobacteriota bacterium]